MSRNVPNLKKNPFFLFALFLTLVGNNSFGQYSATTCMGVQTVSMNLDNGVITGTIPTPANQVAGMQIKYSNCLLNSPTLQVDAVFTLDAITWDNINNIPSSPTTNPYPSFDPDYTSGTIGFNGNFQPSFITNGTSFTASALNTYNISSSWTVRFYAAGTNTPVSLPISVEAIDNDGTNSGVFSIWESITFITTPSSIVTSPGAGGTPATDEIISGNTVTAATTNNQPNIGTGPEYTAFANYGSVTGFSFKFNHKISVINTTSSASTGNRYSSLSIGCNWPGSTTFSTVNLTGTVFNDVNGLTNSTVDGTGIGLPSGTQLYANLLSTDGVTVLATVAVNSNGTYTLPVGANTGYTVQISTTQGVVGSAAPATTLPSGWVATGETGTGTGTGSDGTVNSNTAVTVATTNVSLINFGIEQLPTPVGSTATTVPNPGGTTQSADAASLFAGTDPSSGTISSLTITSFPTNATSISIGGTVYTTLAAIQAAYPNGIPTNASGVPTVAITVDPISGATTVSIPFKVTDNAGFTSTTTSTVNIPFSAPLGITGINLSAALINNSVNLSWFTLTEINTKQMVVERSVDGVNFDAIGHLNAAGNSNQKSNYSFNDNSATAAAYYYRIKVVDADGSASYSNTLFTKTGNLKSGIRVYPTVMINNLEVEFNNVEPGDYTIAIYNQFGQMMQTQNQKVNANLQYCSVNKTNLMAAGIYVLNIKNNTEGSTFSQKIMVK